MRSLPHTAAASKGATGYGIRCALLVEFTSGDRCYTSDDWNPGFADCPNRRRVVTWGGMSALLESSDPRAFAQAQFSVVISDPDGELRDMFEDEQFQKRNCSLYWAIFTPGEAPPTYADAVRILRGTLVPPVVWREGDRAITMEVTDLSADDETLVGARATVDDFEWISEDNEGRAIPIVYGAIQRMRPILLNRGPMTKLVRFMDTTQNSFVVSDAENFPQNVETTVEIGREVINGSFNGNLFTTTGRGVALFNSTTTSASTGGCTLYDTNIGAQAWDNNRLVGYDLKIVIDESPYLKFSYQHSYNCLMNSTVPAFRMTWGTSQVRRVIRVVKGVNRLEWNAPFTVEKTVLDDGSGNWDISGAQLAVGTGVAYSVGTSPQTHQAGDEVLRFMGLTTLLQYAVGMGTCTIRQVYVHGHLYKPRTIYLGHLTAYAGSMGRLREIFSQITKPTEPKDDWIPLRPDLWQPGTATAEGKTITTLDLVRYPTQLGDYICDTDDILVDIEGPTGGDGSLILNPAEVIENLYAADANIPSSRGLVGYWKFDEDTGNIATDSSPNGNDGTLQGNTDFTPNGRINGAVDIPGGATDEVDVPNSPSLQAGCAGVFSVAFWIKFDSFDSGTEIEIMTKKSAWNSADGFTLRCRRPGSGDDIRIRGSGTSIADTAAVSWDTDWHHITVLFNSATVSVYFDGSVVAMNDALITTVQEGTAPFRIGFGHTGADFNGVIDDVRIYDRLISVAEISALASGASGGLRGGTDAADAHDQLTNWRVNFARAEVLPLREFTSDLAMQARSRIRWLGDAPDVLYLGADGGDADLEIAAAQILQHSVTRSRDEMERAASHVTVSWGEDGQQHALTEIDTDAETAIGEREFSVDAWAYDNEQCPRALARFFLETMKRLHDRAALSATVHGVGLEPGDIIDLETTTVRNVIAEFDANQLVYAGDFDEASWSFAGATVAVDATSPPANISTASKLEETAVGGSHQMSQALLAVELGSYYRFAYRIKADERTQVRLGLGAGGFPGQPQVVFDIPSQTILSSQNVTDYSIESLGDDWYLCWVEALSDADADTIASINMLSGGLPAYAGTLGQGLYLAGAQFYRGNTTDEYMPTWNRDGVRTNVSLTRALASRNLYQNRKLLVGGDEYDITENGLTYLRVAGNVDGDGHSVGDAIEITDPQAYDPFLTPLKGRAEEVVHEIGVEPDVLPREDLRVRLFRWPGCSLACEGACETTGCETACESYYEPGTDCWTCETSCQTACEHFCETGGELFCSDHGCETALVVACQVDCQVSEMADGVPCGFCQTSCQSMCESDTCETSGLTDN